MRFVTTDARYLEAAHAGAPRLGHRKRLRLAWLVIRDEGAGPGGDRVARILHHLAELQGEGDRYHETLTRFWIHLVGHAIELEPGIDDFDAFVAAFSASSRRLDCQEALDVRDARVRARRLGRARRPRTALNRLFSLT